MKKQFCLILFGLLCGGRAFACSCVPASVSDHFERATYVFTAVIAETSRPLVSEVYEEIQGLELPESLRNLRMLRGSIRLVSRFKGDASLEAVYTQLSPSMCGISLVQGEEYLFFASDRGVVGLCGGNVARSSPSFAEVVGDVRRLRSSLAPEE